MEATKNILVATDFSEIGEQAVRRALEFAAPMPAHVYLLHVCPPVAPTLSPRGLGVDLHSLDEAERAAHRRLEEHAHQVPQLQVTAVVEVGDPAEQILRSAQRVHADLIVTGTHGRRGLSHVLLGSVAESVLRGATCPVMIVRASDTVA